MHMSQVNVDKQYACFICVSIIMGKYVVVIFHVHFFLFKYYQC